jgi:hypothetical protein
LVRVFEGAAYELGTPCGYQNQKGEMVVPIGEYPVCWTDTIRTFGIVADEAFLAINQQGQLLYEVYTYDNGPDWQRMDSFALCGMEDRLCG